MDTSEILTRLTTFVAREFLDGDARDLTPTTPLLEWGVLDSLSMLALLSFIDETLRIDVPDEMVRPEYFQNLGCLSTMLTQLDQDLAARNQHHAAATVTSSEG